MVSLAEGSYGKGMKVILWTTDKAPLCPGGQRRQEAWNQAITLDHRAAGIINQLGGLQEEGGIEQALVFRMNP